MPVYMTNALYTQKGSSAIILATFASKKAMLNLEENLTELNPEDFYVLGNLN